MKKITLFVLLNLILMLDLTASTVTDLYNTEVPIDGYRSANNKQVLQKGLLQVLVKVTGNSKIDEHPKIREALETPENYILKFTQEVRQKASKLEESDEVVATKQLVSLQNFSAPRIENLLSSANIVSWGQQRPLSLAWIMIEFGPQNRIVLNESDTSHFNSSYKDIILSEAAKRAVPVAFPIQDLEEQLNISPAVIWAQFPEELSSASKRYDPDVIISGSIKPGDENTWVGNWLIIQNGQKTEFTTSAPHLTKTLLAGVNWLADNLAKVYTRQLEAPVEAITVKITGVKNIKTYTDIEKYLESLSVVDTYQVANVGKDWLSFSLKVKSGKQALLTALGLDSKLVEAKPGPNLEVSKIDMAEPRNSDDAIQFRWRS